MAYDVFISYSTRDKAIADAVCSGLEAQGVRCWIAPRDILPGQAWAEAIIDAIDACQVFVLLVSSASNYSSDVLRELQAAAENETPIVPFRIEDSPMSKQMRYYLGTPHWLDALTPPIEKHIARLSATVDLLLDRATSAPTQNCPHEDGDNNSTSRLSIIGSEAGEGAVTSVVRHCLRPGTFLGQEAEGPGGLTMVWVPEGSFLMGTSDDDAKSAIRRFKAKRDHVQREQPIHQVTLTGFWIGKAEVTAAQWHSVMKSLPRGCLTSGNHPVVGVSYRECTHFCERLRVQLPTEAQWEYAARGPEGRRFPWGDEWDPRRLCWDRNRGPGRFRLTWPVGSFPSGASWCGALDMAGNASEWCVDWMAEYPSTPQVNPSGPDDIAGTGLRVCRGGSYAARVAECRCQSRGFHIHSGSGNAGLRVVINVAGQ